MAGISTKKLSVKNLRKALKFLLDGGSYTITARYLIVTPKELNPWAELVDYKSLRSSSGKKAK